MKQQHHLVWEIVDNGRNTELEAVRKRPGMHSYLYKCSTQNKCERCNSATAVAKSHRTANDKELIRWDAELGIMCIGAQKLRNKEVSGWQT